MLPRMDVERHEHARDFLAAAGAWLAAHEARFNLLYAIADRLAANPAHGDAYFASVRDGADVVGAALMTPPYPMLVTDVPAAAMAPLVDDLVRHGFAPTGVTGPWDHVQAFADLWCPPRDLVATTRVEMRAHALERVEGTRTTRGAMRIATLDDLERATAWTVAFFDDVRSPSHEDPRAQATRWIEDGPLVFWDVPTSREGSRGRETVAMAAVVGRTPNGRRIAAVYTPPEHRRHGYGEAVVAALTQHVLDQGVRRCFLYTDAANPTSNALYRRIGYVPVQDVRELAFTPVRAKTPAR